MPAVSPVAFDIAAVPFSTRGAWLNLSHVTGLHRYAEDLHLVSHRTRLTPILRLRPWDSGSPVTADVSATSATLTWTGAAGTVEAVFDGPEHLRLRGSGLGLRLEAAAPELTSFSGTYFFRDAATGDPTFTSYETGRRYRVTVVTGDHRVEGAEALGPAVRAVTVTDPGTGWEIVVEEFTTARAATRTTTSFEDATVAAQEAFSGYLERIAGWRTEATPAADLAAYVLWSATVSPDGFLSRETVLMSKHWMDKVWSWDHCFNALALADGEPDAALDQFLVPFDHQTAEGALPDSVAHSEILHNFVKPPIHGWALAQLLARRGPVEPVVLQHLRDRLAAWTEFWLEHRRRPGHELAHYQHGNDSGWDNSTSFDGVRLIETPDLAAFLVLQLDVLADLEEQLGAPDAAERHRVRAGQMFDALGSIWDGDTFTPRTAADGEPVATTSLLNLMPLVLGERLSPPMRAALVHRLRAYLTAWGAATEPPTSEHYRADGYWRGPIWAPSTVLLEDGLRRAGENDLADEISASFRRLCETHGFAENFDALSGEGLRDRAYTWTAAAYLILARQAARPQS